MGVGDRKDEDHKQLHEAILKSGVFSGNQERELKIIFHKLGFANMEHTDRMKQFLGFYLGETVDVAITVANANKAVSHKLKGIPTGFIIIDLPESTPGGASRPILYRSDTAWTSSVANFWSPQTGTFKVLLWREFK